MFFGLIHGVEAVNCGDTNSDGIKESNCSCGDTVKGSVGYTYTLPADLTCTASGLIVGSAGIIINGGNHTITGDGGAADYGIKNTGALSNGYDNITVENLTINNFGHGIYFLSVTGSLVDHVNANSNTQSGIYLKSSSSNTLTGNTISLNPLGIVFSTSSTSNTLTSNVILGNTSSNFSIETGSFNNTIGVTNTVEGKPVYYFYNNDGTVEIPLVYDGDVIGNIGMFWCIDCDYVQVKNATLATGNDYGVYFNNTTNSTIDHITTNSNGYGIYLESSNSNTLTNNTAGSSGIAGIYLLSSDSNTLTGNTINANYIGITLSSSTSNVLSNNIMAGNTSGNLYVDTSFNNTIGVTNTVEGKPVYYLYGVSDQSYNGNTVGDIGMFWCINCSNVTVSNATLSNNNFYGVYFNNTTGSTIDNIVSSSNFHSIYLYSSTSNDILNSTLTLNADSGIHLESSTLNDITNNVVNLNGTNGIYLLSSDSNILTGNTGDANINSGIRLSSSDSNILTNNTMSLSSYSGIYLDGTSASNSFTSNKIINNWYDIYDSGTTNTYSSNQFIDNIDSVMMDLTEDTRTKNVGGTISSTMTMYNPNADACATCSYTVTASPSETVSKVPSGNEVAASFSPTKSGTYSLIFTVTDSSSNTAKRRMVFLVGDTDSETTKYYYRGTYPTRGQPKGRDSGSLSFTAPTNSDDSSDEWNSCQNAVQSSPNELPDHPLFYLTGADIYVWYKSLYGGTIGMSKHTIIAGNGVSDISNAVALATEYTWVNSSFSNINWIMDYFHSWYFVRQLLVGDQPYWTTFPTGHTAAEASYTNFTYSYTTTPAVKSMSNTNINVLSATAPATGDTSNATLVLDGTSDSLLSGTGATSIVLSSYKRPFQGYTTTINSDGTATLAATGITSTTTISSVPLDITPNAGTIAVSAITTDTKDSGVTYYPSQWTENGSGATSAVHIISNLKASTYYTITATNTTVDHISGTNCTNGLCLSTTDGQITFTYNGGYSEHTFGVQELSSIAQITSFTFASPSVIGTINNTTHTVLITVPYSTDVTNLTPTIAVSTGATISPASGVVRDFSNPVTYTVTAQDTVTTQNYTVTVAVAGGTVGSYYSYLSSEKNITSFSFPQGSGVIAGTNITVVVPHGTNVTNLTATFVTTGSSVKVGSTTQINKTTSNDFTNPVTYVVTAADNSTQSYTVTVHQQTVQPTSLNLSDPVSIQKEIQRLQGLIQELLSQQNNTTNQYIFTNNLRFGDADLDVKYLQQYLNANGFQLSLQGLGSPGKETTRFGSLTKQALIKFQEAHADQILKPWFTKGTGIFGPMTRNFINGEK